MPKISRVSTEEAISALEKYISHFKTSELPNYTSSVWTEISTELKFKWTAHTVYINVREDRRSILSIARSNMGVIVQHIGQDCSYISDTSFEQSNISVKVDPDFEFYQNPEFIAIKTWFPLSLTIDLWNTIKPQIPVQYGKQCRVYDILAPSEWTDTIFDAFHKRYRFQCAYIFKRAKVFPSPRGLHYMQIVGRCKSKKCSNPFFGYVEREPGAGEDLNIKIKTRDTSLDNHEAVKRPLRGSKRQIVAKEVAIEGCSNWQKRMARENLQVGEMEPPNSYKSSVLAQAKKEYVDSELNVKPKDGCDLVRTIEGLMTIPPYVGSIQAVGSNPFFCFYMTTPQVHAYNEYCRLQKWSSINIDSTGSIVRSIKRSDNTETGHIFLTVIVTNFDNKTLSVNQMLSERLTTEFIEYWLRTWIRNGANTPKEAVSDYSRALLSAMSLAFNNQTIKSYVAERFLAVSRNTQSPISKPNTYIRVDVAHLMHAVSRWKCFDKVNHECIRQFYIRCVALMVDAETFEELEELIFLTIVVAVNDHEDSTVASKKISPKVARTKLETCIAIDKKIIDIPEVDNGDGEDVESMLEDVCTGFDDLTPAAKWLNGIRKRGNKIIQMGSELNAYYLPKFADRLMLLAKEFPLWTGVAVPNGNKHATSSFVEEHFKNIKKHTLAGNPLIKRLPVRVDRFLKVHIKDIIGTVINFESTLATFKVERLGKIQALKATEVTENNSVFNDKINNKNECHAEDTRSVTDTTVVTCNNPSMDDLYFSSPENECNSLVKTNVVNAAFAMYPASKTVASSVPVEELSITNTNVQNLDDSDLKSYENWRNKARRIDICSVPVIEKDKIAINPTVEVFTYNMPSYDTLELESLVNWCGKNLQTDPAPVSDNENCSVIDDPAELSTFNLIQKTTPIDISNGNNVNNVFLDRYNKNYKHYVQEYLDCLEIANNQDLNNNQNPLTTSPLFNDTINKQEPLSASSPLNDINIKTALSEASFLEDFQIPRKTADEHNINEAVLIDRKKSKNCGTKKSFYFRKYPEIKYVNAEMHQKVKKNFLLRNGSCTGIIKVNKISYKVYNTCAFDSISHILVCSVFDSNYYASFLGDSTNKLGKFVLLLAKTGTTTKIYQDRVSLLIPHYQTIKTTKVGNIMASLSVDAEDSVSGVWKKLFNDEPSEIRTFNCTSPHCNTIITPETFLTVNHRIIAKEGFNALEKALQFHPYYYNVKCSNTGCSRKGTIMKWINFHLFIELDIRVHVKSITGMACTLSDFPIIMNLNNNKYRLAGIIHWREGHYIAYSRRLDGRWEMWNDLDTAVRSSRAGIQVVPIAVIYIIIL